MSSGMLNKTPMVIAAGSAATETILHAAISGYKGELAQADDTGRLWICPANGQPFVSPVGGSEPTEITGSRSSDLADIVAQLLAVLADAKIIEDSTTP